MTESVVLDADRKFPPPSSKLRTDVACQRFAGFFPQHENRET
jgi:hypothetical protein